MECPVVRIKCENEQGFCLLNEADFDSTKHELFTELSESVTSPTPDGVKVEEPAPVAKIPAVGDAAVKPPWAEKKSKS